MSLFIKQNLTCPKELYFIVQNSSHTIKKYYFIKKKNRHGFWNKRNLILTCSNLTYFLWYMTDKSICYLKLKNFTFSRPSFNIVTIIIDDMELNLMFLPDDVDDFVTRLTEIKNVPRKSVVFNEKIEKSKSNNRLKKQISLMKDDAPKEKIMIVDSDESNDTKDSDISHSERKDSAISEDEIRVTEIHKDELNIKKVDISELFSEIKIDTDDVMKFKKDYLEIMTKVLTLFDKDKITQDDVICYLTPEIVNVFNKFFIDKNTLERNAITLIDLLDITKEMYIDNNIKKYDMIEKMTTEVVNSMKDIWEKQIIKYTENWLKNIFEKTSDILDIFSIYTTIYSSVFNIDKRLTRLVTLDERITRHVSIKISEVFINKITYIFEERSKTKSLDDCFRSLRLLDQTIKHIEEFYKKINIESNYNESINALTNYMKIIFGYILEYCYFDNITYSSPSLIFRFFDNKNIFKNVWYNALVKLYTEKEKKIDENIKSIYTGLYTDNCILSDIIDLYGEIKDCERKTFLLNMIHEFIALLHIIIVIKNKKKISFDRIKHFLKEISKVTNRDFDDCYEFIKNIINTNYKKNDRTFFEGIDVLVPNLDIAEAGMTEIIIDKLVFLANN